MATSILLNHERPWAVPFSQTRELGGLALSCVSSVFSKEEFMDVSTLRSSSLKFKEYTWDKRGGSVYRKENAEVIAVKCVMICLGLPFFTLLKVGYAAGNTLFQVAKSVARAVKETFELLLKGCLSDAMWRLKEGVYEATTILGLGIWEIVKGPLFCAVGIFIAACGVVSPYCGRRNFAALERIWNHHSLYIHELKVAREIEEKEELLRQEKGECAASCYGYSASLQNPYPRYLANCFQPRGMMGQDVQIIESTFLRYSLQWLAS